MKSADSTFTHMLSLVLGVLWLLFTLRPKGGGLDPKMNVNAVFSRTTGQAYLGVTCIRDLTWLV